MRRRRCCFGAGVSFVPTCIAAKRSSYYHCSLLLRACVILHSLWGGGEMERSFIKVVMNHTFNFELKGCNESQVQSLD